MAAVTYKIMRIEGARECHKCGRPLRFTANADIILYMDDEWPEHNPKTVGYVCAPGYGCLRVGSNYALSAS